MADYNDYLKYLKHVDDTTAQDFKAKEDLLKKDISDLKAQFKDEKAKIEQAHKDEKSKLEEAFKNEKAQLKNEISESKKKFTAENKKLSVSLENVTKERDDLLMNLDKKAIKATGNGVFRFILLFLGFIISLPLAGIPIFIYRKVRKRKIASKLAQEYEIVREFYDKRAVVKLCGKYGYVNTSGKIVIPLKYDDARDFTDKKAQVKYEKQWLYINKSGVVVQ